VNIVDLTAPTPCRLSQLPESHAWILILSSTLGGGSSGIVKSGRFFNIYYKSVELDYKEKFPTVHETIQIYDSTYPSFFLVVKYIAF